MELGEKLDVSVGRIFAPVALAGLRNCRSGWPGLLAAAWALLALAVLPAAAAPSASSVSRTRADSVKITVPSDPCGDAWARLPAKYRKDITIGGATLSSQTLVNKKCNEFKDDLVARMRAPFDEARAAVEAAPGQLQAAAMARLRKGFLSWAAEVAREEILPTLPPEERAKYDINSPLVQQKAHEWLNDPSRELGTYVSAYVSQKAPLVNDAYKTYVDLVEGDSRKIIDGLNGILQKARGRLSRFTELERAVETAPKDTPWADLLSEHGFSGNWIDSFKGYEGEIRALNEGYEIKETVTIIVGAFNTDDPRQKISGLFELIDTVSGVAQESNVPIVSLFGDIVNAYAQVAKAMLEKVNGLEKRLRERAGYCLGTGVPADDPRNDTLDARGILACPLAHDRKPWADIYETVEPTQGEILFWNGKKFIDGARGGGGKTGVQESIALMTAARDIGYPVPKSDVGAIAEVFNTPFEGGIPGLMKEARKVIGEITARARQLEGTVGTGGQCSAETIIAHVESMTGLRLQAFLDQVNTEGQSRLVTTYAASYVASTGGFGKSGGKRAGAFDRYREIREKLKDVRVVTVYGEVRDVKALTAPACAKCAGATIKATISGGEEVSGCEVRTPDDRGDFVMHIVATAGSLSISLGAQVKDAQGETLRLAPTGATASAKLPVKFPEEKEDEAEDRGTDGGEDEEGKGVADDKGDEKKKPEPAKVTVQCDRLTALVASAMRASAGETGKLVSELNSAEAEAREEGNCDPDVFASAASVRERLQQVSALRDRIQAAVGTCDVDALPSLKSEASSTASGALNSEIALLETASTGVSQFKDGKSTFDAGDYAEARAPLQRALSAFKELPSGACQTFADRSQQGLDQIDKVLSQQAIVDRAIDACDVEDLKTILAKYEGRTFRFFTDSVVRIRAALPDCEEESAGNFCAEMRGKVDAASTAFMANRLKAARQALLALDEEMSPSNTEECPELKARVRRGLDQLDLLQAEQDRLTQAETACDIERLKELPVRYGGKTHPWFKNALARARGAIEDCQSKQPLTSEEAIADCRRQVEAKGKVYAATDYRPDGSYKCHWCEKGQISNGVACVTDTAAAEADCRRQAAVKGKVYAKTEIRNDGSSVCHWCEPGQVYANGKCGTVAAHGEAECRQLAASKGKVYAKTVFHKNGKYDCLWCEPGQYFVNGKCWTPAQLADAKCRQDVARQGKVYGRAVVFPNGQYRCYWCEPGQYYRNGRCYSPQQDIARGAAAISGIINQLQRGGGERHTPTPRITPQQRPGNAWPTQQRPPANCVDGKWINMTDPRCKPYW